MSSQYVRLDVLTLYDNEFKILIPTSKKIYHIPLVMFRSIISCNLGTELNPLSKFGG